MPFCRLCYEAALICFKCNTPIFKSWLKNVRAESSNMIANISKWLYKKKKKKKILEILEILPVIICCKSWTCWRTNFANCLTDKPGNCYIACNIGSSKDTNALARSIILSSFMRKPGFCHMRTTKPQISLRIRAVWSAPLLSAAYIVLYLYLLTPKFQDSS